MSLGRSSACLLLIAAYSLTPRVAAPASPCGGATDASPCCVVLPIGVVPDPGPDFIVGCARYVLLSSRGGNQGPGALLDLPSCPIDPCAGSSGAQAVRCWAANGYPCCLDSLAALPMAAGNKSGTFRQGLHERWAKDTDQLSGICYTEYTGNGMRVVLLPIVTFRDEHGGRVATRLRYGRFFLVNLPEKPGDDLLGNFMGYVATP